MTEKNSRTIYPTPEEDAEINRQIAEDPDTREWTEEDWANAKSTAELFPGAAKAARKRQADLDAGRTEYITLLLDRKHHQLVQGPDGRGRRHRRNKVARSGGEDTARSMPDGKPKSDRKAGSRRHHSPPMHT